MMLLLSWIAVTQLVLPIGLLVWLWRGRPASRAAWLARVLLAGGVIGATAVAGIWLVPPWPTPLIYLSLWLVAGAAAWRRVRAKPWLPGDGWRARTALATMGAASLFSLALLGYALTGWRTPAGDVARLDFPLRDGTTYMVVNGGSNLLLNLHLDPRFSPGQGYAIDVVEVDALGLRADGLLPSDPGRYAIFGDLVHAPCTGTVVRAADGWPDLPPPAADAEHPAGNHVVLRCTEFEVWLAHLQQGSVRVGVDERVRTGDPIGRVGNSGNTSEPHLHLHAQRPADFASGAVPVPMLFEGAFLVRNDRLTTASNPR